LVGGLLFWANAPRLAGWEPRLVLSGSMRPAIDVGDVVVSQPVADLREVRIGDVIVVRDPAKAGGSYVHRVVRRTQTGLLVTRGDANTAEDFPPVGQGTVIGRVRGAVPAVGRPLVSLLDADPWPMTAVVLGCAAGVVSLPTARSRGAFRGPRR
jgi:signal peptidase